MFNGFDGANPPRTIHGSSLRGFLGLTMAYHVTNYQQEPRAIFRSSRAKKNSHIGLRANKWPGACIMTHGDKKKAWPVRFL